MYKLQRYNQAVSIHPHQFKFSLQILPESIVHFSIWDYRFGYLRSVLLRYYVPLPWNKIYKTQVQKR